LLLTFVDYCLLLMTLVLHLCSACNRRTINFYMMMMMMMMIDFGGCVTSDVLPGDVCMLKSPSI